MKGQANTLEPIVIVIILGILAAVGIIFFMRISDTEVEQEQFRIEERDAIRVLKVATTMPELACPRTVSTDTYCLDLYKARAMSKLLVNDSERIFYQPLFGISRVTLSHYDLTTGDLDSIILYDLIGDGTQTRATSTHFTVYDPIKEQRQMAIMTVQREVG